MEPRVKLYMSREESFPVPLKYIEVTRTTETTLDVMSEKKMDDYWNVDGDRELSDTWTGFTRFTTLSEEPPDVYPWSGRRLTRKQTTSTPNKLWPEMWKHLSDASKRKAKQKWAIEKPKLDNAKKLRGIYFIDSEDEEFKNIMKNARRKLGIPMPAAMPCKTSVCSTKYACIVEADESLRKRKEGSPHKNHDHIAGKGMNSLSHYKFGAQIYSCASSNENTRCKGSSGERMGKTRKNTA